MATVDSMNIGCERHQRSAGGAVSRGLPGVRRAVDVLHVYVGIRDIEVYEHASNMRKVC